MKPLVRIYSRAIPLPLKNIDTDLIIPAQHMTSAGRSGYGQFLFRRLREADSMFPLDQAAYRGAEILVVDSNFGCGSSREHAVWALLDAGIKVVIAPSFADIFRVNGGKSGLLLITLPSAAVSRLLRHAADSELMLEVDLERQRVTGEGIDERFHCDTFSRCCFLNGQDELDYILMHRDEIDRYRESRRSEGYYCCPGGVE